jgi:hypothetical protein
MRPTTAGTPSRSRSANVGIRIERVRTATTADGSATSGSEPPPTKDSSSRTPAAGDGRGVADVHTFDPFEFGQHRGERESPRTQFGIRRSQHPQRRDRGACRGRIAVQFQRGFEGRQRHFVQSKGPHQRIGFDAPDQIGPTGDQPRLRPAEQFIAAEKYKIGPGPDPLGNARFVRQTVRREIEGCATADIIDDRNPTGPSECGEGLDRHRFGEAADAIVAGVDTQDQGGVRRDGPFVVAQPSSVGGPDFAEPGAAGGHDVRKAKAAADFNEFPA